MMKLRVLATAVLFAAPLFAQMHETVSINIVEVPVSVIDSSGNPVRGLTAANFELYDSGKKQVITSFDKIDFGSNDVVNAISPLNPAARRSFLLLFDLTFSGPKSLVRAQEAARNFVKSSLQPRDVAGVGTIDNEQGFRLLTAFTSDRDLIESAIANPRAFRGTDPLQIANLTSAAELTYGAAYNANPLMTPAGDDSKAAGRLAAMTPKEMKERSEVLQKSNEEFVRTRVERQVDALGQLATALRAVPGHKQLIFLSEGFDPKSLQGRDVRDTAGAKLESDAVAGGAIWTVENDARYGNVASNSMLDRMAAAFHSSDVVLHAVDIQGVRVQSDVQSGANLNSNAGLFVLARPTGGQVFQNSNDLKKDFDRILHAQEAVYVLAFQRPAGNTGKYHELKVKLVNTAGRLNDYRTGYYEEGAETATERSLTTAEVIMNDRPQSELRLAAFAAPFPGNNGRWQVPIILDLNGADLDKAAKGGVATAEIFVYAFDTEGIVRDRLYQTLRLDLAKVGERLRGSGVRYYGTLMLPPGSFAIKSLVRSGGKNANEVEKRGYSRTDIVVPHQGDVVVLPPIPIDDQRKWILVKAADRGVPEPYPFELNGQSFIPSATASDKVALVIYGASSDELTWETTPKTKMLGSIPMTGGTKLLLQLDDPAQASALQVTVHKKGVAEAQKTNVAVVRP